MNWHRSKKIRFGLKPLEEELSAHCFLRTIVVADRKSSREQFCKPLVFDKEIGGTTALACFHFLSRTRARKKLLPAAGLIVLPENKREVSPEVITWIERLDPALPLMVFVTGEPGFDRSWLKSLNLPGRYCELILMSSPGQPATLIRDCSIRTILLRSQSHLPAMSALAAALLETDLHTTRPISAKPDRTWIIGIFLLQDLNLLLPLIRRCISERHAEVVVVTHWQIIEDMPRISRELAALGLNLVILDQKDLECGLKGLSVPADAVITASDTTAGPHIAAYLLALWANQTGVPSYTMQHGLENIGLTYQSDAYGSDIRFASETVFIWGPVENLPDWVSEETRAKAVTSGSPKPVPLANSVEKPHAGLDRLRQKWNRVVGVFENLHWERYPDEYRNNFMGCLPAVACAFPKTLFVVKTHPAGRWLLSHGRKEALQDFPNVFLPDPTSPEWADLEGAQVVKAADAVITTPSTVALDAAREKKPVGVIAGHGQDTSPYLPLTMLETVDDWTEFLGALEVPEKCEKIITRSGEFPAKVDVGGDGIGMILDHISRASLSQRSV